MAAASNKKVSLCILLILGTLVLDHLNTLTSFFKEIGKTKFSKLKPESKKKEYILNIIVTVCYAITLVVCLLSLL
jgi:hypothetical protein